MTQDVESDIFPSLGVPLFRSLSTARDSVFLCSPFIGFDVARRIAELAGDGGVGWQLMTALNPVAAAYGALSLDGLRWMIDAGVEVRHLSGLHAKVFLVDDVVGFAGSANLTSAGLGIGERGNFELTVGLTAEQRSRTREIVATWWGGAEPVTATMIEECKAAARRVPVRVSRARPSAGDDTWADSLLEQSLRAKVWLKAMYVYRSEPWVNSSKRGKPSFRAGDILVIYVKKTGCCSVVQVTGETTEAPDFLVQQGRTAEAERWPWVTPVKVFLALPPGIGAPLAEVGKSGRALQGGHSEMPVGGFPLILRTMLHLDGRAAGSAP